MLKKQLLSSVLVLSILASVGISSHAQLIQNGATQGFYKIANKNTEVAFEQVSINGTRAVQFTINTAVDKNRPADKSIELELPEVPGMRYDLVKAQGLKLTGSPAVVAPLSATNQYRVSIPLVDRSSPGWPSTKIVISIN